MRLAVLSDIHGNLPALEAVVRDFTRRGVDAVINLGDSLSGPLLPLETAQFLRQTNWTHLAGNHEQQILDPASRFHGAADAYARSKLSPAELAWIAALPTTLQYQPDIYLCHGTPLKVAAYLLETVTPDGVRIATPEEIARRIGAVASRVILCGHTHFPRAVRLASGQLIVNPGSVGLPGFDDDTYYPHVIETGSPDARYAIIENLRHEWHESHQWMASLISVPYDNRDMIARAEALDMPDWAIPLATGYALRAN